jgi:hypothetical protein
MSTTVKRCVDRWTEPFIEAEVTRNQSANASMVFHTDLDVRLDDRGHLPHTSTLCRRRDTLILKETQPWRVEITSRTLSLPAVR